MQINITNRLVLALSVLALAEVGPTADTRGLSVPERGDGKNNGAPSSPGCCSYHGGVCGCSAGRAVCCDGRLSPSCGC